MGSASPSERPRSFEQEKDTGNANYHVEGSWQTRTGRQCILKDKQVNGTNWRPATPVSSLVLEYGGVVRIFERRDMP